MRIKCHNYYLESLPRRLSIKIARGYYKSFDYYYKGILIRVCLGKRRSSIFIPTYEQEPEK